jgi:hypothetical protein
MRKGGNHDRLWEVTDSGCCGSITMAEVTFPIRNQIVMDLMMCPMNGAVLSNDATSCKELRRLLVEN